MPRHITCQPVVLLAVLLAAPTTALAVEPLDQVGFSIGTYASRFDTRIRGDGITANGTRLDLDRDLGLDPDDTIAFARLAWRPLERHEFGLAYFSNGADADHRLERDLVFEDQVYRAGVTIHGEYDLDSFEAYYTWWAFSSDTWALGPRLGVNVYRLELGLEMKLDVDGNPVGSGSLSGRYGGDLPAPTLGASWRWTPGKDWRVVADAGWMNTTINHIDGTVAYARLGLEWHPWRNAGLMLDYNYTNLRASTDRGALSGRVDLRDSGLRAGLVFRY